MRCPPHKPLSPSAEPFGHDALSYGSPDEYLATALPFVREGLDELASWVFGPVLDEQRDWLRYEAILNAVFTGAPLHFLCAYDRRALLPTVVDTAERTHPHLREGQTRTASARYEEPGTLTRELAPSPPVGEGTPVLEIDVGPSELASTRAQLARLAHESCSSPDRAGMAHRWSPTRPSARDRSPSPDAR